LSRGAMRRSTRPEVWSLVGMSVSHLISLISRTTLTRSYSDSLTFCMNLIATSCLEMRHRALNTYP
jgi:hypothetical protein